MIRPAGLADAPEIARIEAAAAHSPWSAAAVQSTLGQRTSMCFVVDQDGIVGHLLASAVVDEGEVLTVAVHPTCRRRGLGRALLSQCQTSWAARGVLHGFLEVRADNHGAIALYRSSGWTESGRRSAYYADRTDALLFRWQAP